MKSLYNEYLTGIEREAAIIVAESDAQFARLNVLMETVDATLEANKLVAEAKVFAENGTYDDLTMLYTEAENEAAQKKKGIIATILGAIGSLFARIGKFLNEKFGKNLENMSGVPAEVQVSSEVAKKQNIIQRAWNVLKSPVEMLKNENASGIDIAKAWAGITAEFATVAGGTAATVMVVKKREEIFNWLKGVGSIRSNVQNAISSLTQKLKKDSTNEQNAEASAPKSSFFEWLKGTAGKAILDALEFLGGKIVEWIGQLGSLLGLSKNEAKKVADNAVKGKKPSKKEMRAKGEELANNPPSPKDTRNPEMDDRDSNGYEIESVSIFGVEIDDEIFTESEISEEELNELSELFSEL